MSTDIVMQHSNDNYRCRHTGTYLPLTTFQWSICTLLCPLSMSEGWECRQSNTLTRLSADPLTSMFTGAEAMSRQETCWFIFYFSQFCLYVPLPNKESSCLVWNPANVIVHCFMGYFADSAVWFALPCLQGLSARTRFTHYTVGTCTGNNLPSP